MSAIKLENVSKFYKSTETVSVGIQKVNLDFKMGEFVAVTGESGSGKSTLLNVISGLDSYEEGEFFLFGEETSHYVISDWEKYRSAYVGFVFQNYNIIDSYSILQNVLLALEIQGYDPKKKYARAMELIDKVGLKSHAHHKASKLSGGQKQRAVIARALAKDCPIIVADEPTGNLDTKSAEQVMKLLHEIAKEKLVVVVTHDFDVVAPYATRKIKMHDGEVVEDRVLRQTDEVKNIIEPKPKVMNFKGIFRFALRNLFSTPKRTVLLLTMQLVIMLGFTLLYSTIQTSLMDEYTSNTSMNINVPETRLLVEKRDGSVMTQSDYDYLNNLREVDYVYEKGMNFYNDTRLYVFNLDNLILSKDYYGDYYRDGYDGDVVVESSVSVNANFFVSGTDAAESLSSRAFDGTMPVAENEVIIDDAYGNFSIGDHIAVASNNYFNSEDILKNNLINEFIITGISKNVHGSDKSRGYIFFSDAFLKSDAVGDTYEDSEIKQKIENSANYNAYLSYGNTNFGLYPYENVMSSAHDEELVLSLYNGDASDEVFSENSQTIQEDLLFTTTYYSYDDSTFEEKHITRTITIENVTVYLDYDTDYEQVFMSPALFNAMRDSLVDAFKDIYTFKSRDAFSLTVSSQAAGNRVLNRIDSSVYRVYYPANVPSPTPIGYIIISWFLNGILIVFVLLLYVLLQAITKNVMKSRSKDFAIYRSIGAQKAVIARLVVLELFLITIGSIISTAIVLYIMATFIPTIATYLTSLTIGNYVFIAILFIFLGTWLGLRFNKRVFKQSVIQNINASKEVV